MYCGTKALHNKNTQVPNSKLKTISKKQKMHLYSIKCIKKKLFLLDKIVLQQMYTWAGSVLKQHTSPVFLISSQMFNNFVEIHFFFVFEVIIFSKKRTLSLKARIESGLISCLWVSRESQWLGKLIASNFEVCLVAISKNIPKIINILDFLFTYPKADN